MIGSNEVEVDWDDVAKGNSIRPEVLSWLQKTVGHRNSHWEVGSSFGKVQFWFSDPKSAMLFKLTWQGATR